MPVSMSRVGQCLQVAMRDEDRDTPGRAVMARLGDVGEPGFAIP